MAEYGYRICKRCKYHYTNAGNPYCLDCLRSHPKWAPDLGCGDLGCTLRHDEDRETAGSIMVKGSTFESLAQARKIVALVWTCIRANEEERLAWDTMTDAAKALADSGLLDASKQT